MLQAVQIQFQSYPSWSLNCLQLLHLGGDVLTAALLGVAQQLSAGWRKESTKQFAWVM